MRSAATVLAFVILAATGAAAGATPITVYLDRHGEAQIPAYGGGDRAWNEVVGCVRAQFAPFQLEIVDRKPAGGAPVITVLVGGHATDGGIDDDHTNGVGPYSGEVIPDAVVNVFSQEGTGELDIENVCAVAAHEVGHALGLEHEYYCGDVMSYFLDQCGTRRFLDVDAPCGEAAERACASGARSQNSYQLLAKNVGLREQPDPAATSPAAAAATAAAPDQDREPDQDDAVEQAPPAQPAPEPAARHRRHRHVRRVYWDGAELHVQSRN